MAKKKNWIGEALMNAVESQLAHLKKPITSYIEGDLKNPKLSYFKGADGEIYEFDHKKFMKEFKRLSSKIKSDG